MGKSSRKVKTEQVDAPEAIQKDLPERKCSEGHTMSLHHGSRKEGALTCDGPPELQCCDGDGVIEVGMRRFSCVACDFDVCCECAAHLDGVSKGELNLVSSHIQSRAEDEAPRPDEVKEQKEGTRQRLRDAASPKSNSAHTEQSTLAAAPKEKTVNARQVAIAAAKAKETVASDALAAEAAAAQATRTEHADAALMSAVEAGDIDALKSALSQNEGQATNEALLLARKARDKLKDAEKKAAQKLRKAAAPVAVSPVAPALASPALAVPAFLRAPPTPPLASTKPAVAKEERVAANTTVPFSFAAAEKVVAATPQSPRVGAPNNPLLCPLTEQLMIDPVFTADGYTYERKAIENHLKRHDLSPLTGEILASKALTPNMLCADLCRRALQY